MAIDFFSPEYQEMIRRSLAANPNAGLGLQAPPPMPISGQAAANHYSTLAHANPDYVTGRADLEAQGTQSGASASERIRQQLIAFGIIPEGFQDKYGWVNDETRMLAQQNTQSGVSTFARIQKAYADAARRSKKLLAARGMLRSGELGHNLNESALLNRQNLSDATGKLLDANRGVYDTYTTDFNARANAFRALEKDAFTAVKDSPLPQAPAPPSFHEQISAGLPPMPQAPVAGVPRATFEGEPVYRPTARQGKRFGQGLF